MDLDLVQSCKKLKVANEEVVQVVWKTLVDARIDGQMRRGLTLYVVRGKLPSLLGREWISEFFHSTPSGRITSLLLKGSMIIIYQ